MTSTQARPTTQTTTASAPKRTAAKTPSRTAADAGEGAGTTPDIPEHASTEPQAPASAGTEQAPSEAHQVQQLDPRGLLVDLNVRHDTRLDPDFVASVRELGVLVTIVAVRTAGGDVRVRMGHRRTLAAIEAGRATVPVIVAADEACDDAATVERLVTQWAENEHRTGLSNAERVDVIGQLSAFGISPTQIARRTRASKTEVEAALVVTASEMARKATARYDFLDLTQAATVAEFDTDPDAVQALVVAARDGRFDHVAQRLRDERTHAANRTRAAEKLREQGVRVIDTPTGADPARSLRQLGDGDGGELTPDGHSECPGHAAYITERYGWVDPDGQPALDREDDDQDDDQDDEDDEPVGERQWRPIPTPVFACTDPAIHGHPDRWPNSTGSGERIPVDQMTDEQRETARAERRDVIDSNKTFHVRNGQERRAGAFRTRAVMEWTAVLTRTVCTATMG